MSEEVSGTRFKTGICRGYVWECGYANCPHLEECGETYRGDACKALKHAVKYHMPEGVDPPFSCSLCDVNFTRESDIDRHGKSQRHMAKLSEAVTLEQKNWYMQGEPKKLVHFEMMKRWDRPESLAHWKLKKSAAEAKYDPMALFKKQLVGDETACSPEAKRRKIEEDSEGDGEDLGPDPEIVLEESSSECLKSPPGEDEVSPSPAAEDSSPVVPVPSSEECLKSPSGDDEVPAAEVSSPVVPAPSSEECLKSPSGDDEVSLSPAAEVPSPVVPATSSEECLKSPSEVCPSSAAGDEEEAAKFGIRPCVVRIPILQKLREVLKPVTQEVAVPSAPEGAAVAAVGKENVPEIAAVEEVETSEDAQVRKLKETLEMERGKRKKLESRVGKLEKKNKALEEDNKNLGARLSKLEAIFKGF